MYSANESMIKNIWSIDMGKQGIANLETAEPLYPVRLGCCPRSRLCLLTGTRPERSRRTASLVLMSRSLGTANMQLFLRHNAIFGV